MAVTEVGNDNFEREVLNSEKHAVVDFWAPWCGYCRRLTPVIERLEEEYGEKIKVAKVNIDQSPQLADKYGISAIPALVSFDNGRVSEPLVGPSSMEDITGWLSENGAL